MTYEKFKEIPFENSVKKRLRQIYAVLFYMKKRYDHVTALKKTAKDFEVDKSTIQCACTRRFAGDMKTFIDWYD